MEKLYAELIKEIDECKNSLALCDKNAVNFIFLTDTHFDTAQTVNNQEVVLNSIKCAVEIANTTDIDFVVIGGDYATGWYMKDRITDSMTQISNALVGCKKPVLMLKGNHDDNKNPNTNDKPEEWMSDLDIYNVTQKLFRGCGYVYDEKYDNSTDRGLYYYIDIPNKKTRVICLDSYNSANADIQAKWVAEEALNIKDADWKYIIATHNPLDVCYTADKMICYCGKDIEALIKGLNSRSISEGSFGTKDFRDYKSNVVAVSCGHVHASLIKYDYNLDCHIVVSGHTGVVGTGKFLDSELKSDDEMTSRFNPADNSLLSRYLFDILSVDKDTLKRIRFGNGIDKVVKK